MATCTTEQWLGSVHLPYAISQQSVTTLSNSGTDSGKSVSFAEVMLTGFSLWCWLPCVSLQVVMESTASSPQRAPTATCTPMSTASCPACLTSTTQTPMWSSALWSGCNGQRTSSNQTASVLMPATTPLRLVCMLQQCRHTVLEIH